MAALSYQLYSSRDGAGNAGTLRMLAASGYGDVEGFGPYYEDVAATKAALADNGLTMTSGHFAVDLMESDPAGVIATASDLGIRKIYAPYLQEGDRPTDRAGWEAFAARLVTAAKPLQAAGFTVGWHNHDFEMVDLGGGVTPLDIIAGASSDLAIELDLGWVAFSGHDPVAWVNKLGGQIGTAHIKDRAPEGENTEQDGWATVGTGTLDWPAIFAACKANGVDHFVVEHDNPPDDAAFAAASATYLKGLLG